MCVRLGGPAAPDGPEHRGEHQARPAAGDEAEDAPGERRGEGPEKYAPRVTHRHLARSRDLHDRGLEHMVPVPPQPPLNRAPILCRVLRTAETGKQDSTDSGRRLLAPLALRGATQAHRPTGTWSRAA